MIIDSAAGWNKEKYSPQKIGYGVVPKHINQIIETPDDEIKFMINGFTLDYDTFAYNIPVPEDKEKFPFVAKATLCYFPKCSRNQGVDYTNTELDIHFGTLKKKKNGKIGINPINRINNLKMRESFFMKDKLEKSIENGITSNCYVMNC